MWTVVYVASNEKLAQKIKSLLAEEGFLVKINHSSPGGKNHYEVLVPTAEIKEAKEVLPSVLHRTLQESGV